MTSAGAAAPGAPDARPVAIASDHAGLALKEALKKYMVEIKVRLEDLGTHDESSCDYPDFAHVLARGIVEGHYRLGVLVCGSGIGMSMAANRHAGVRAAVCTEAYAARITRAHNDANVLCLGSRIVGPGVAEDILRAFLEGGFEGGRHARRVAKIEPGGT
jgi:ribose 5-phosphate isomerase B